MLILRLSCRPARGSSAHLIHTECLQVRPHQAVTLACCCPCAMPPAPVCLKPLPDPTPSSNPGPPRPPIPGIPSETHLLHALCCCSCCDLVKHHCSKALLCKLEVYQQYISFLRTFSWCLFPHEPLWTLCNAVSLLLCVQPVAHSMFHLLNQLQQY